MYEANLERFSGMDAQVVGISMDSTFSNGAWAKSIGNITYPLLSDYHPHGAVAKSYGVLREQGFAERALFIVDKQGIVRYIDVHEIGDVPDETVLFEELAKLG
ncbi:MAG: hypothetical protein NVS2B17_20420 [Candidatus Velthaea sp.]